MPEKTDQNQKRRGRPSSPDHMIIVRLYEPDPDIHERLRPVFAPWIQQALQRIEPAESPYGEGGGSDHQGVNIQAIGWDESR